MGREAEQITLWWTGRASPAPSDSGGGGREAKNPRNRFETGLRNSIGGPGPSKDRANRPRARARLASSIRCQASDRSPDNNVVANCGECRPYAQFHRKPAHQRISACGFFRCCRSGHILPPPGAPTLPGAGWQVSVQPTLCWSVIDQPRPSVFGKQSSGSADVLCALETQRCWMAKSGHGRLHPRSMGDSPAQTPNR